MTLVAYAGGSWIFLGGRVSDDAGVFDSHGTR
jgi:hypothetical protein